jgi:hypothetical protein
MGLGGYKTPVPGLYLSGSGTHPIAGINGMPGMNAAKTLIRELKRGRNKRASASFTRAPASAVSAANPAATSGDGAGSPTAAVSCTHRVPQVAGEARP